MYIILYKSTRYEHDPYDRASDGYQVKVDTVIELKDEDAVKEWIERNDQSHSPVKGYRVLKCEELTVKKTVSFAIGN
jgi:hypothetical protein